MRLDKKTSDYKTLVDVIIDKKNSKRGITFVENIKNDLYITYKDLYNKALKILFTLQKKGIREGNELIFQVKSNIDFVPIFWACLLGKVIPVPVTMADNDRYRLKLLLIWDKLNKPYMIISSKRNFEDLGKFALDNDMKSKFETIRENTLIVDEIGKENKDGEILYPDEHDIAFIQFSSGSTSDPKGVTLTHKNLLTNTRAVAKGYTVSGEEESMLSWMPLTHDLGIIGYHLTPVVADWNHILIPSKFFIRHPSIWLKKISEYRITNTCSPNFAYKHVLKFFKDEEYEGIDLSCLNIISNGAEPISSEVCDKFLMKFEPYKLKKTAMFPGYGLAEASVIVTFSNLYKEVVEVNIQRDHINIGEKIKEVSNKEDGKVATFVEVGTTIEDCFLRIVDDNEEVVGDRVVGNIQISGDNVMKGYYNNKEATERAITDDGWVRTGDLGFLRDGNLVITGRKKDVIFVNGNSYYAHDIEFVCNELEEFRSKKIAVCGVYNPTLQTEEIICFVVFRANLEKLKPLVNTLKKHVIKKVGVGISHIIPVKQIPVTTSRKVQRYKLKERYLKGEFNSIIQQLAKY